MGSTFSCFILVKFGPSSTILSLYILANGGQQALMCEDVAYPGHHILYFVLVLKTWGLPSHSKNLVID